MDEETLQEWDELDAGTDADTILQRRVERAQGERDVALVELRAVMSDPEVLEEFGIDLSQIGPGRS